jgi:hypothetical protein
MEERLIEIFKEYLPAWNWEEWQAAGASDKEDIVINALADLGPDMPIEVDEAYDLFWDWAAGLTEADFNTSLTEAAQKKYKITYREDGVSKSFTVWASSKAEAEQKAWSQVDADSVWVTELNEEFEGSLSDFDGDPNEILRSFTSEYSYSGDAADLACISNRSCPSKVTIDNTKEAEKAAIRKSKEDAQLQAKCLAAAQKAIETGDIEIYNRGRWSRFILTKDFCPAVDPETLELVYDPGRKSEIYNQARRAYFKRQSEYRTNYAARRKAKTEGNLEEAIRIGAGNDALYHYTNLIPFMKILKTDTMKRPDDHEDYAICFTTDEGYRIFEFCFGLQFSRERLAADGYDLLLWDDAEEDNPEYADFYRDHPRAEDARTESEERIYDNIPNVSKYITDIHLHWSPEGKTLDQASDDYDNEDAFIDIAHGKQGDKLIGYEGPNDRMVLVPMSEFKAVLLSLKSKGVQIHTYGTRMKKMYVYDERGKVHKVPAYMRMPKAAEPALV